jgi:basic amino acid/polyamine antiporter, APA family
MAGKGLFATRTVAELRAGGDSTQQLKRTLSVVGLTAFGIGSIIGTGIFVLTGTAAANHAGPALALSFILAGFGCGLTALCYAELAAMIPVSGSAYCRVVHRLEPGPGIHLLGRHCLGRMVGLRVSLLEQLGINLPEALTQAAFDRGPGSFSIVTSGALVNETPQRGPGHFFDGVEKAGH